MSLDRLRLIIFQPTSNRIKMIKVTKSQHKHVSALHGSPHQHLHLPHLRWAAWPQAPCASSTEHEGKRKGFNVVRYLPF